MGYPTEAELVELLEQHGIPVPARPGDYLAAAISDWEKATGYSPFLAEGEARRYLYDAPRFGVPLDLGHGFFTVTEVRVDIESPREPFGGRVLTESQDYVLLPYTGPPFRAVRFITAPVVGIRAGSILITGRKGYAADVPSDVRVVVLNRAAMRALLAAMPLAMVKQGEVSYKFDYEAADRLWRAAFLKYRWTPLSGVE